MTIKAIFFDFWGTLVENGVFPSPVKQVKFFLRLGNLPFSDFIVRFEKAFMTKKVDNLGESFDNVIKEFGIRPPHFVIEKCVGMWNKNMLLAKTFNDTKEVLKELKKDYKLVLIANSDPFSVPAVIEKFGLEEFFDEIVYSYKEESLKSEGELYDIALKKLDLKKDEVIMLGDSIESDIESADKFGIRSVLVDRKDKREFSPKIVGLNQIKDTIKTL